MTRHHQPSQHKPPNLRPPQHMHHTHTCRDVSAGRQVSGSRKTAGPEYAGREKEWAAAAGEEGRGGQQSSTGAAIRSSEGLSGPRTAGACLDSGFPRAPSASFADACNELDVFPPALTEDPGRFLRGTMSRNNSDSSINSGTSLGSDNVKLPKLDIKVLIVDDEAINTKIISSALTKRGLHCTSASDGTEVVDLIVTQGRHFDIMLIDTMMKVMDGPEAVAAVRQHEWNRQLAHLPVLAVTASILRPDQEMCMRAGYQGLIAKPIAVKSLATEVLTFLERWKEGPESKMIRSPHDWRSDSFCSLMRNNMVRVSSPPPLAPSSLSLPPPVLPPTPSLSPCLSPTLTPFLSPHPRLPTHTDAYENNRYASIAPARWATRRGQGKVDRTSSPRTKIGLRGRSNV